MSVAITGTVVALLFLIMSVVRLTIKVQDIRYEPLRAHRCPEPEVVYVVVEKPHDPWKPTPWKVVS